jgi:hypothetical protein
MNVHVDRDVIARELERSSQEDGWGLPRPVATGKSHVTDAGILWHEFKDHRNTLFWATSSVPYEVRRYTLERALTASDFLEMAGFDEMFLEDEKTGR